MSTIRRENKNFRCSEELRASAVLLTRFALPRLPDSHNQPGRACIVCITHCPVQPGRPGDRRQRAADADHLLQTLLQKVLYLTVGYSVVAAQLTARCSWSYGLLFHQGCVDLARSAILLPLGNSIAACRAMTKCSLVETTFLLLVTVSTVSSHNITFTWFRERFYAMEFSIIDCENVVLHYRIFSTDSTQQKRISNFF